MIDDLLKPAEVAQMLHTTERSLYLWRQAERGPAYVRLNARTIRYRRGDVAEWLANRRVDNAERERG
jgi:predicted DNA-binding transcriptional regulator AlpA